MLLAEIQDNNDGTYTARFTPFTRGSYSLLVKRGDRLLGGTGVWQFTCTVRLTSPLPCVKGRVIARIRLHPPVFGP